MQAADRSLRSVFVGNIPYDATEEKLRDIFKSVGPVLSFRIVFDRDTGKPKGYGFCEYKDQETATSAIRNLNGHDLGGRQLRVDSASNERARDDGPDQSQQQQHQQQQQQQQPQLGADNQQSLSAQLHNHQTPQVNEPLVDAQTVINNLLHSLPPEQLFETCKQLKNSLLVNPNETRQLLVQNPQLSFAVLQSLVMINAIDSRMAMNTIHKPLMQPAPLQPAMPMMAMMQPQVLNPYAFAVAPQATGIAPTQQAAPVAVSQLPQPPVPTPMAAADPRLSVDPRLAQATSVDPRISVADPRVSANDPRLVTNTVQQPGGAPMDPRLAATDPRLVAADPRLARQQQQQAQQPHGQQVPPQWPFAAM